MKNHIRILDLDGGVDKEEDLRPENMKLPTLIFQVRPPGGLSSDDLGTICFHGSPPRSRTLFGLMVEAQSGLAQRLRPERQLGGSAGTYMLRNQFKDPVACFKPFDEEPG